MTAEEGRERGQKRAQILNGTPNPDSPEARLTKLENDFALLAWLYAELLYGLRLAAAQQLAQQMQPQVQQALVDQIMAGAGASP